MLSAIGLARRTRNESIYFHPPYLVESRQRSLDAGVMQPVSNRLQRQCACHRKTTRSGNDGAVCTGLVRQLREEPALADAGIARDDKQSRPALDGSAPQLEDLVELLIAPHQQRTLSKPRASEPWLVRAWQVGAI